MAAENTKHGDTTAAVPSNGYASDAGDQELSNGTTVGAITPLHVTSDSPPHHGAGRRVRSGKEQKLIARGRHLLQLYQQKQNDRSEMLDEMCFSSPSGELNGVEILGANGFHDVDPAPAAAAASIDSDENWLGRPSNGKVVVESIGDWNKFQQLQSQNEQLLGSMEKLLDKLWGVLDNYATDEESIDPLRDSISLLVQQKRQLAASMTRSMGPRAVHTDYSHATNNAMQSELGEAKTLISELNHKVNTYKSQLAKASASAQNGHASSPHAGNGVHRLEIHLQEKEELLQSLRTSLEQVVQDHGKLDQELRAARLVIERLESEKAQMQKAATDKRTLLHRAYVVKAKQMDQLCKDIELPPSWERVTDENDIIYYRQNDRACAPELEDPRVALALPKLSSSTTISLTPSSSPRSAAGRMEQAPHVARSVDRKYSSSSFDSTVSCEDIAIPPDDGMKHEVQDFETPLPDGWEMRVTTGGSVFFVNRNTNVTTWKDPRRSKRGTHKRASAPADALAATRLRIEIPTLPERSISVGELTNRTSHHVRRFDVEFEEKGPIGIHFQANTPDEGATLRRLLPRMAAARKQVLEPYDRLVAVNNHPVDTAPFRHVMLLLQGGLRPLVLTFERDPLRRRSRQSSHEEMEEERSRQASVGDLLDEEVVMDEASGTGGGDEEESRRRRRPGGAAAGDDDGIHEEDFSIADKIITNLFTMFWTPPDQPRHQVETV